MSKKLQFFKEPLIRGKGFDLDQDRIVLQFAAKIGQVIDFDHYGGIRGKLFQERIHGLYFLGASLDQEHEQSQQYLISHC